MRESPRIGNDASGFALSMHGMVGVGAQGQGRSKRAARTCQSTQEERKDTVDKGVWPKGKHLG